MCVHVCVCMPAAEPVLRQPECGVQPGHLMDMAFKAMDKCSGDGSVRGHAVHVVRVVGMQVM